MGDVDLRALQLQLQQQRSSLADQILARLPEASASANAPRVEETRRSSTLGLGAQGEQRAQSAADRKLRAKLSAKPRREHVEVREKEEEEEEDKAAMGRRMAKRKADPFAAAEAKVQAGKERAGQSWAPDLAHMSKAQRKKWNKRRRLEEESGAPVCAPAPDTAPPALTSLQSSMLSSLKGAHFRAINERLYTTDSRDAHAFMQQEPHMFDEYHEGFRQQVRKWPINPVDRIAELLLGKSKSKYTMRAAELSGALVVDIGAGEAALAKKLAAKRFHMLSYDLIDSADGWVCGLDAAKVNALPLPGTFYPLGLLFDETWPVPAPPCADLVVFCLSLMGTNWVEMIAEAWRVLRNDGELLLAEVTSRLGATGATDEFVALVESLGFALAWQDTSNTHFVLCSFVKRVRTCTASHSATLDCTLPPHILVESVSSPAQARFAFGALVKKGAAVLKPLHGPFTSLPTFSRDRTTSERDSDAPSTTSSNTITGSPVTNRTPITESKGSTPTSTLRTFSSTDMDSTTRETTRDSTTTSETSSPTTSQESTTTRDTTRETTRETTKSGNRPTTSDRPTTSSPTSAPTSQDSDTSSSSSTDTSSNNTDSSSSTSSSTGAASSASSSSGGPTSAPSSTSSATGAGAASSESTSESGNESQITSYSKLTTFVDGQPTTSTRMVISTASNGSLNDVNDNKTGFWHDSGAVGGTFAAVGIVTLALLIALAWLLWRRRKAKRMDADVVAAASAAAATSRTPFDDDDDDMMMSEVNGYAPDGALSPFGSNAVMPFYGRQAPEPGYPIQSHAASDDPYASDVPLAHQNALDYLTNANSRGTYVPVPNENGVPFDAPSSSGMFAAGLGAAAAAGVSSNGFEDPFRNSEDTGASHYGSAYGQPVGAAFSGHGSERNSIPMPYDERSFSAATQYNDAPESMHSNSQPRDAAIQQGYPLGAPAQPSYAADAPMQPADVGSSFQQAEPPFPMSTAQHDAGFQPMHAQALHPAAYAAANAKAAPAGFAAAQYDQLNEPPSYMFSAAHFPTNEKAAQDAKASAPPMADPSVSSALAAPADAPASLVQHSPELHPGAHLFSDHGDHGPADSQSLHGDWDPPALSSAWFPGAGQSVASGAEQSELTEAQARPFVTAHKFAEGDYPTASVVQSPQRLVVRNPSPEDV
ncbi:25S rRNA (adenine(645)-N(1))-methyltransferase [Malassezia vespertilionis]|uniref:25S rRNA (adenine(645)-N(1))-methyltransferase n=1 Tax=Malassezia vespertilionis TaxID=2020962 RepID=UPI0024B1DD7E|nr:25S rRNA (adenine(645)-N(1))-methyltransferase [Malassezia vespertilionis]WFD07409.1 25S rRNA (adenine(645)-N(1))-methyltransferase [Malassezia vespertilionis]